MSGRKLKRECGKDKTLGAPSPLPESCLATYRDVFLATEYEEGGEEACVEAVKDHLVHLFSKVTPTLSVIEDKSVIQKIQRVDIDCNEAEVTDILDEIELIEDNLVVM